MTAINIRLFTVCNREVGTIIRSLGCCPTEAELTDMLVEVGNQKLD